MAILALTGCALLSGCGLRLPASEVRSATAAATGSGAGVGAGTTAAGQSGGSAGGPAAGSGPTKSGGNGSTSGGSTGSGPVGATSSNGGGSAATGSTGGGGSVGGGTAPAGLVASAPSGGNGGATAVGVTATSITVGNVSDVGGPVPGLFAGGPLGTEAYFDYINSLGGVYGRQLKLVSSDDGLQCSQNEADYSNEVGSVFAFVGSWSLDDNCGAQIMQSHPDVPMVQEYLSPQMADLPDAFGETPYSADVNTGPFLQFKQMFPGAIDSVGTLVGNQASAVASWDHTKQAIESIGYKVVYEDDFPPAQSNFTSDVIRMKAQGVKMVMLLAVNAPDAAIFASEAAQQGFKPQVWLCPVCYFGGYVNESGGASAVNGQYSYLGLADFLGDPSVPEVATFLHWLQVADANFVPDEFAATSWANAALFVHALVEAGPDLTQAKVVSALRGTDVFDDNGMVTSADVGTRSPSNCYNILEIQNGNWVKIDDPSTGFRCDGSFVP